MTCDRTLSNVPACRARVAPAPRGAGKTEVSLCGEIDLANAAALEAELLHACAGPNCVINVDLHAVTFIDAAAVNACLTAQRLAREQGRELVFSKPRGIVLRVIRVLGLESVLLGAGSDE